MLIGRLTQGIIRPGMNLVYTDREGNYSLLPISDIGFTLSRRNGRVAEMVTLCIPYENESMLSEYKKLDLVNRSFYISRPAVRVLYTSQIRRTAKALFASEDRPLYGTKKSAEKRKIAERSVTTSKKTTASIRKIAAKKAARKKK